jgi:hypothetical protein
VNDRLRIGDTEREAAARELGEHFALGRITADEHAERLEQVWAARTAADLTPVFGDLPRPTDSDPRSQPRQRGPRGSRTPGPWLAVPHVPFAFKLLVGIVVIWWGLHHPLFLLVAGLVYVVLLRRVIHRQRRRGRSRRWAHGSYQTGWH